MYHRKPLEPGQAFSFAEPHELRLNHAGDWPVYMQPGKNGTPELTVLPSTRLIVQDEAGLSLIGTWQVKSWLHGNYLSFHQQCGQEEVVELLQGTGFDTFVCSDEKQAQYGWAVTDVGWPDPTPESLMIQVRVLSYYELPFRSRRSVRRYPEPLLWSRCRQLFGMELKDGLVLALEWLRPYVEDPAAALRERGFAV